MDKKDDRNGMLTSLRQQVHVIAAGPPALEILYGLETAFIYTDDWQVAREELAQEILRLGNQACWISELRRPPPDLKLWVSPFDRRRVTDVGIQQAITRWQTTAGERFFRPHHHIARVCGGVAALHVSLLSDLDPVAAVEYAADLPAVDFVWPSAHSIRLDERPDLVDRVLAESASTSAALLCFACELEAWHARIRASQNAMRWAMQEEEVASRARDQLRTTWIETLPNRMQALAQALAARMDASAVAGPLMRHLVESVTGELSPDTAVRSRIARSTLEAMVEAIRSAGVELQRAPQPDAACVVARILMAKNESIASLWDEWMALVSRADRSLTVNSEIHWAAVGRSLLAAMDPLEVWCRSARELEPVLRARARKFTGGVDPNVHLIMPAVEAAKVLGPSGASLWRALYERSRRHYFVGVLLKADFGYWLCSYVFAAFPYIFGDAPEELERALRMLPTKEHEAQARRCCELQDTSTRQGPAASDGDGERVNGPLDERIGGRRSNVS